jgi:putative component of membrane protein insertase Oxa1/YidC/SpoIIIJ protein YidD
MGWVKPKHMAFFHLWQPKYKTYKRRCDFIAACQKAFFETFPHQGTPDGTWPAAERAAQCDVRLYSGVLKLRIDV